MQQHRFMGVYNHITSIWAPEFQILFFVPFLQSSRLSLHLCLIRRCLTFIIIYICLNLSCFCIFVFVFVTFWGCALLLSSPRFIFIFVIVWDCVLLLSSPRFVFVCWRWRDFVQQRTSLHLQLWFFRCGGSSGRLGNHLRRSWCRRFSDGSDSNGGGSWKRCFQLRQSRCTALFVLFAQQKN